MVLKQVLVGFDATLRRRDVGARAEGALMRKESGGVDPALRASRGVSMFQIGSTSVASVCVIPSSATKIICSMLVKDVICVKIVPNFAAL